MESRTQRYIFGKKKNNKVDKASRKSGEEIELCQ